MREVLADKNILNMEEANFAELYLDLAKKRLGHGPLTSHEAKWSDVFPVTHGLVQPSMQCPLLCLIYVNDMPFIIKHSELSMLIRWRSTLLFLLKSNWHGEHPKCKDWFAIANWILLTSRRPNPCLFAVICSYVRSWACGSVYVLNNEGQRAGIFEYLSLFAFLQLDILNMLNMWYLGSTKVLAYNPEFIVR